MKTVIRNGYTPHEDDYCNTLVIDRESDTFYFFDSDGVWTKFEDYGEIQKLSEALDEEIETRAAADQEIWGEIEAIEASSDVVDVVGTYADLQAYDTSKLHANDLLKVLQDETHNDAITYYRWDGTSFTYVGMEGPYYTASEVDNLLAGKQDTLTAGTGITIQNGVISATGVTYTAGANIQISPENVISATDTTYSAMTGATSSTAGTSGLVPAPAAGDEGKFLQGDGTWATVQSGATYTEGVGINIDPYNNNEISTNAALRARLFDLDGNILIENASLNEIQFFLGDGLKLDTSNHLIHVELPQFIGATAYQAGESGAVPAPAAGDQDKYLKGDGTWATVQSAANTIFYMNASESGGTRHIYKNPDMTGMASSKDVFDANELGQVILRISTSATPDQYSDCYLQNAYKATGDYQLLFLDEKTYRSFDTTNINDTSFIYATRVLQSELTAGTNIQINGTTISATDTTYSAFVGATSSVAGSAGLVPAPTTSDPDKFLKGDGTWGTPVTNNINSTDWNGLWQ